MIQIRKSLKRGHSIHGWLDSYHTFSFAEYKDPQHTHYRTLRAINEDRVAPGKGFGMHSHHDMEIITYVVSGELMHNDSMGNAAIMRAGDVQRISAGSGILHSESNESTTEPVHFLQIWIEPDIKGATPDYVERAYGGAEGGGLFLVASRTGRDESIPINQDANVYLGKLETGDSLTQPLEPGRHVWLQLIKGGLEVNGSFLKAGDGAAICTANALAITANQSAEFLVFDLN